jgi:hypothetical protein
VEISDVADSFKMAASVFNAFQSPTLGAKGAMTELNVAIGLLGNAGIKGSDAGTSLKQALLQLTGPSNKAKDAMKALYIAAKDSGANEKLLAGITKEGATERGKSLASLIKHNKALGGSADIAYDAAGRMRSLHDIVKLVTKGTKDMTAEERNAYLTQIFGSDAVRTITVLMQDQNGQWGKMEKAVGRAGAAQQVANAKMKGLNGAMEGFKSTIETLAISFGTTLLPPLTKAFQALSGLAPILQQNKTAVMVVVGALGALAAGTWAVNLAMAANPYVVAAVALAGLVIGIVKAYQASETFRGVVLAVFNAIQTAFTATVGAIVAATQAVVNEVKQWDTLWSGIKRVFGLIEAGARLLFSTLKTIFQVGMIAIGPVVAGTWVAIQDIFSGAWKAIKGIVVGGFTVLRGVVKIIGGLFKGDFHQVWDGIQTIFRGGITALKGILSGAWSIMKAPIDALAAGIKDAFSHSWDRIKAVFRDSINTVIDFLNLLISAINAIPGIPDIKKIGHIGGSSGGGGSSMIAANTKAAGGQGNLGGSGHLARGGAFARTKGLINRPMTFMGEEAPAHPEFIIPTNPAYRSRAVGLLGQAAKAIGFAQGGVYSQSQLAALWSQANPGLGNAKLMAAIAEAESGGRTGIQGPATRYGRAKGLWQILGLPFPGNPFDPLTNAKMAGAKLRSQGLGAWEAYTNGSYKKFLGGGGGGVFGAIGGFISGAVDTVKNFLGSLPSPGDLGMFSGLGKYVLGKAKHFVTHAIGSLFGGGGGGASSGPNGVGSFGGVPMANWVIQSLQYAQRKLGVTLHPTSGYRPGFDPHTASGTSQHSGTQYPHGAVDFGGYHDPRALATKMAVVNATRDFKWPLLAPMGFVDDGHASGTGHYKGGVWGRALGSYEHGTPFVPQTGLYALHKGEAVMPAMKKGGKWGGTTQHPTYNGFDIAFLLRQLGLPVGNANQNKIRLLAYLGNAGSQILIGPNGASLGGKGTGTGGSTDTSSTDGSDPNQALIDSNNAVAAAQQALADALAGVKASIDAQTAFATSVSNTSNYQLTKTLSDLLSGHIVGYGVAGRSFTPGTGVEVAYAPSVI